MKSISYGKSTVKKWQQYKLSWICLLEWNWPLYLLCDRYPSIYVKVFLLKISKSDQVNCSIFLEGKFLLNDEIGFVYTAQSEVVFQWFVYQQGSNASDSCQIPSLWIVHMLRNHDPSSQSGTSTFQLPRNQPPTPIQPGTFCQGSTCMFNTLSAPAGRVFSFSSFYFCLPGPVTIIFPSSLSFRYLKSSFQLDSTNTFSAFKISSKTNWIANIFIQCHHCLVNNS